MQVGTARKKERASTTAVDSKDKDLAQVREEKIDIEKKLCVVEERANNFKRELDAHSLSMMSLNRQYSTLPRPVYKEPVYQNLEEATCSSNESSRPSHSLKKDAKDKPKISRSCSKESSAEHKDGAK